LIERKSTSAKELRRLEDVHDDLRKMNVKGWGGKMKNREEVRQSKDFYAVGLDALVVKRWDKCINVGE
jgi:hypothetical protein